MGEFLDGFGEGGVGWGGGGGRGEEVRGQEVQAEGEVWGGEDGEGFDEDVGDGFVAGEVRVELVSVAGGGEWFVSEGSRREDLVQEVVKGGWRWEGQIELII